MKLRIITFILIALSLLRFSPRAAKAQGMSIINDTPSTSPKPFITSTSVGAAGNLQTNCRGFNFTAPASNPPTVKSIGRWVISGNSQTHDLYIGSWISSTWAQLGTVTVNTSGATSGQYLYGSITPVALTASVVYIVLSCETSGGDQNYQVNNTTLTTNSAYGTSISATFTTANPPTTASMNVNQGANHSYIPVNFLVQ